MKTIYMEQTLVLLHNDEVDIQPLLDVGVIKKLENGVSYLVVEE